MSDDDIRNEPEAATSSEFSYPATAPTAPMAPPYKLYMPAAVGWATFIGSPIAGSIVMAINYRRLGQRASAGKAVVLGLLGTVAAGFAANFLPEHFPTAALGIGALFAMNALAKALQGELIEEHTSRGGALASNWRAAGVGLLVLIMIAATIFGTFLFAGFSEKQVEITHGQVIRCTGDATEADARLLGGILKQRKFFSDDGLPCTVVLDKEGSLASVSFVMAERAWTDQDIHAFLKKMVREAGDAGLGIPIEVRVVDPQLQMHWKERID